MFISNWRSEGKPFKFNLYPMFSHELDVFFLSDMIMSSSSVVICLPLHWLLRNHWIGFTFSKLLQFVIELGFVTIAVTWTQFRSWHWPQTAVFCLHSIAVFMKIHSYISASRDYELQWRRLQTLTNHSGSTDQSKAPALRHSGRKSAAKSTELNHRNFEIELPPRRRVSPAKMSSTPVKHLSEAGRREQEELQAIKSNLEYRHTISIIDQHGISHESKETGVVTKYPENCGLRNFVDFLIIPSFVYQLGYPRTDRIRIGYLFEKTIACFGIVGVLYFMIEHVAHPALIKMNSVTLAETILQLIIPFLLGWLMIFYVMFEVVGNFSAEVAMFADREFYSDWWNSSSYDEFSRRWNKPVHHFLLVHVYGEAVDSFKYSKTTAMLTTYLFSSILHELVASAAAKKPSIIFFTGQMSQVPLIWFGQLSFIRARPILANFLFWACFILGMPLLAVLYSRDMFLMQQQSS